jgi:hypothetical protein
MISNNTLLSAGNYGRYLDIIWSKDIISSGHIRENPFPTYPSLFSNANSYKFNLLPAVIIVELSSVLGVGIYDVQMTPILGIIFFFSVLIIGYELYDKNHLALIVIIILEFFLLYINIQISREINRIVLAYIFFNIFLYVFLKLQNKNNIQYIIIAIFILIVSIFSYSSLAISFIFLLFLLYIFKYFSSGDLKHLNILLIYFIISISYYLIETDFLKGGIINLENSISNSNYFINILQFMNPGVWPSKFAYIPPYSLSESFLLIIPYIILGVIFLFTVFIRLKNIIKSSIITKFDIFLFSTLFFIIGIALFNSLAIIPTSGLDYISLFTWLAPLSCVFLFIILKTRIKPLKFYTIIIILLIVGILSINNYYTLDQQKAENVTYEETNSASWLANNSDGKIVSDLHYVSTYVTLFDYDAPHFLPMTNDIETIEKTYYDIDINYLQNESVEYYVVSKNMKNNSISTFAGPRIIPNPNSTLILTESCDRIYNNPTFEIYYIIPD